jgi:hypothetical protein
MRGRSSGQHVAESIPENTPEIQGGPLSKVTGHHLAGGQAQRSDNASQQVMLVVPAAAGGFRSGNSADPTTAAIKKGILRQRQSRGASLQGLDHGQGALEEGRGRGGAGHAVEGGRDTMWIRDIDGDRTLSPTFCMLKAQYFTVFSYPGP